MLKINPIKNINLNNLKYIKSEKALVTLPYILGAGAFGATGLIFSTFIQDFNKTVDEGNYFQFKTDKNTGKHYQPDIFQKASGMNLYLGNDVLVTAPTGTGKTAIAEYVITKNLKDGGKTFYTTPLKALSNEKFLDFSKIYGEENVGLLTGDTKLNTNAPIIIMTTEVYRNMGASGKFNFDKDSSKGIPSDLKTVIFDELQYLGDVDRGGIWEQSIMFTPKDVQILSLSATIGNNEEINNWIASVKNRKGIAVTPEKTYKPNLNKTKETVLINVPSENRHVPLFFEIEHAPAEIKLPRGGSKKEKIKAKSEAARRAQSVYAQPKDEAYKRLTHKLNQEGKLPAIYFVFSKKECRHLLKYLSTESELLTTEEEQKEIQNILDRYKKEGVYLGESLNIDALMKGYAIHNAGLLPTQKTLIEELFQKKLVKVVLATETLSAGINMPAKTTVISSPRKPSSTSDGGDDNKRNLTSNEFHQMAGRAGRRGIDTEGFCYVLSCNGEQTKVYESLINSPSNPLSSNLELDYSFIANYMSEFSDMEELEYVLSKSLYTYNQDGSVNKDKLSELLNSFKIKKSILIENDFINKNGKLTTKGLLIKHLNGYEQIPLINIIANGSLASLDAKQIAGIMGGLANIEYNTKGEFPQKPFELRTQGDSQFAEIADIVYETVKDYSESFEKLYPKRELALSPKPMDHLYKWAELNSKHKNSHRNWHEIFTGDLRYSIKDEGTLFKEITMTVDLLKQLIEATKAGEKYADTDSEKSYYKELGAKLQDALALIQKDPIQERA